MLILINVHIVSLLWKLWSTFCYFVHIYRPSSLCEKVLSACRQLDVTATVQNFLSNVKIMDIAFAH